MQRREKLHKSISGSNPIQLPIADAALPMEHALCPVVTRQSWRPLQRLGTFVPFPQGCIVAAAALESWVGRGPFYQNTEGCKLTQELDGHSIFFNHKQAANHRFPIADEAAQSGPKQSYHAVVAAGG